jgi:hypothetical protein
MFLSGYSVRVTGGRERDGYVELDHLQPYSLVLHNRQPTSCDATVTVDGRDIGTWRLPAHGVITVERPADGHGRLTFIRAGTPEAFAAQLPQDDTLGLVRVDFIPVRPLPAWVPFYVPTFKHPEGETFSSGAHTTPDAPPTYASSTTLACSMSTSHSARSARSGGTVLTGDKFASTPLMERDYTGMVTIYLRLVAREEAAVRPLRGRSTPIPPRLD